MIQAKLLELLAKFQTARFMKCFKKWGQLLGCLYKVSRRLLWSWQHWLEDVYCFL